MMSECGIQADAVKSMRVGSKPALTSPAWQAHAHGAQAGDLAISPEAVVRHELENGIVVLIKENPASASVTIEGDIRAGSMYDGDATIGLANLTASMLRRGTAKHTFQELNVALDSVGAALGFSVGVDDVGFSGQALAEDFNHLVDLLAEMIMEPTFPALELDKLRGQYMTQLSILDTDTGYRADMAFMAALYAASHPYARPTTGTRDTLPSLTVRDLTEFHSRYYHPERLVISVVGAVPPAQVIAKLAATLGRWRAVGPAQSWFIPPAETPTRIKTERIALPGKAQVDLLWGVVGMARTSPDYYPAMMANLVLGRLGLMGRLGESVRDQQGLAYYVGSSVHAGPGPHPWNIMAGIHPKNIDRAVASILQEVERLRDMPITDEELEDSQTYLTGALPLHLETNEGIAGFLLNIEEYGLGLDHLQRYPAIITNVTKDDIQRVVRKYLTLDRYALTMAGTFD
jgi:zinc protease